MFYGLLAYFITICILIIAYALIYHHFDRNEEECKDPVILKKKIQKELKEEDEYLLNNLINAQNLNIRYAMKHNALMVFMNITNNSILIDTKMNLQK